MASKKWWDEDEEKKAEERAEKELEIETLEDAIWRIRLMRNSCCDECRPACERCLSDLHNLADCNRQGFYQAFEYEEEEKD